MTCRRCAATLAYDSTSLRDALAYGVAKARAACPAGHSEYVPIGVLPDERPVSRRDHPPVEPVICRECEQPIALVTNRAQRLHPACRPRREARRQAAGRARWRGVAV